jgi:serine/threonine protein kinase
MTSLLPIPHEMLGKYRLLGMMNAGGMAELLLALHAGPEGFSKVVALKRVLPHLSTEQSFIEMFLDEARLAARLDHANLVRVYDFGDVQGRYFLAMEYLPGEDASRVVARSRRLGLPVPMEIAAFIVSGAAAGLHFAHELTGEDGQPLGLVHRDATPSNILVTYYGTVKVLDFGVAKTAGQLHHTQTGMVKGKLSYLAPEQVSGQAVDRRTDVFALGLVLWELLAGRRLYQGDNAAAIAHALVYETAPAPSSVRPEVPPELDAIVARAMAKNPDERFQTAAELEDALEEFLLARSIRPTPKQVIAYMETLFSGEVAHAKRAIAQGRDLNTYIPQVMRVLTPSAPATGQVGSTQSYGQPQPAEPAAPAPAAPAVPEPVARSTVARSVVARAPSPPLPPALVLPVEEPLVRRLAFTAVFVALAMGVLAAAGWLATPDRGTPSMGAAPAALTLESEPPGAFVFLGGEPTGLRTPATFHGLPSGTPVSIRLQHEGHEAALDTVTLAAGEQAKRRVALRRSVAEQP